MLMLVVLWNGGKLILNTWDVFLSIPPMSGIILTVKAHSYVIFTVIYIAVTVGNPKPIIRNGEGGIYCTVVTHSIRWRWGKRSNGQSGGGGHSVSSPAGKASTWRLN